MTPQMIFAFTYVPCVACVGISFAFGGSIGKFFKKVAYIFGVIALCSYSAFLLTIM